MRQNSVARDFALGIGAVLLTGFIGGGLASRTLPVIESGPTGMTGQLQEKVDKSAAASLFGQFRSSIADFLWLQVDKYMHNGIELRGLTPREKQRNVTLVRTNASEIALGAKQHAQETTDVPAAKDDWRGVLGDVEREVQPYKDMSDHTHRDPKEALPLFRLMTRSNPHFIPGYVTGATMIARDRSKYDEAMAFLREGEVNNPESIEIKAEIGRVYDTKLRQYEKAPPTLIEAISLASKRDPHTLTDDENEAWQNAYRWLVLSYRYQDKRPEAHAAAVEGLKHFPRDPTCAKQLEIERTGKYPTPEEIRAM